MNEISQSRRERLFYIDLRVFFCGEFRRVDLEERFGIAPAAATRDLAKYKALAPKNLVYDSSRKVYFITKNFSPVFDVSRGRALVWLREGFGDGLATGVRPPVATDGCGLLAAPSLHILGILSRAIHRGKALKINYISISSGLSEREIVPTALVDNGLRWHVRAFDRKSARFADFVVGRIRSAEIADDLPCNGETIEFDKQWNRFVDLELVPHPGLGRAEVIEIDYGMESGMLLVQARAATAGYFLRRWNVDCTSEHQLDPSEHHLWLRNQETLYGVESAALAPGRGGQKNNGKREQNLC